MKKGLFITMAAATLLLAGCSNDENETMSNSPVELRLTSGVEVQQARATTQSSSISENEVVSVWVDDAETTPAPTPTYKAVQLTANGVNGFKNGSTPMYFPETGNKINIYAIHGKFSTEFNAEDNFPQGGIEYAVIPDQSGTIPANYTNSDLLYAKEKSVARNGNPTTKQLTFYHMLSKLELAIVIGDGGPELATSGAVKLGDVTLNGKFTPSTADDTMTESTRAAMLSPVTTPTTGDMILGQRTCTDFGTNVDYNEAILVPQDMINKVLTFTLADGGTLTYTIPAFNDTPGAAIFQSGKKYLYHITLSLTGLTVTSEIEDWSAVDAKTGTATME